jgi:hypothetical protein
MWLFQILWWIASTTEFLEPDNKYLDGLPPDIQGHLLAIGEWIVGLMGGG